MQKCIEKDYDDYDANESNLLIPKQGMPAFLQKCPKPGDICCVPQLPRCEDTKGHRCVERDVSLHKVQLKSYRMLWFLSILVKHHLKTNDTFSIWFQSCKPLPETEPEFPNSEGDEDYNYENYGDFTLKSGASGNTCSGGKVCCEPKEEPKVEEPKVEEIVCTSMGNYQCLPSDVSKFCDLSLINH